MTYWMQTATGKRFDLDKPDAGQVFIEDIIAALPFIPCFTGAQEAGRHEFAYSTAQHCLLVSHLVPPEFELDGLLHDAWKIYIGDLTKPLNQLLNSISHNCYEGVRDQIRRAVAERFELAYPLPDIVEQGDLKARATELRDVMAPVPEPWALRLPEPDKHLIIPLRPSLVRAEFAQRFESLWLSMSQG